MGVVVPALAGTIADLFASVAFARSDRIEIPMNFVFGSPLDLFSIASAAFIVRAIAADGETTWYEGFLLVGVYVLFALAFSSRARANAVPVTAARGGCRPTR